MVCTMSARNFCRSASPFVSFPFYLFALAALLCGCDPWSSLSLKNQTSDVIRIQIFNSEELQRSPYATFALDSATAVNVHRFTHLDYVYGSPYAFDLAADTTGVQLMTPDQQREYEAFLASDFEVNIVEGYTARNVQPQEEIFLAASTGDFPDIPYDSIDVHTRDSVVKIRFSIYHYVNKSRFEYLDNGKYCIRIK